MNKFNPVRLHHRQAVQFQPPLPRFERANRYVQADDFAELLVLEQFADQRTRTAAEIEHALGTAGPQCRHDGAKPLFVKAFLSVANASSLLVFLDFGRLLFLYEASEGHAVQARLEAQVTASNLVLLWMAGQPALAFVEQLLQFVFADEIMFAAIKYRNEHIKMCQQVRECGRLADGNGEVRTFAPFGKLLVQRIADSLNRVSQRLEDASQEHLAATYRQHIDASRQGKRRRGQFGTVLATALQS